MKYRWRQAELLFLVLVVGVVSAAWWRRQEPANPLLGKWRVVDTAQERVEIDFGEDGSVELYRNGERQDSARYRMDVKRLPHQLDLAITRGGRVENDKLIWEITPAGELRVQEGHPREVRPDKFTSEAALFKRVLAEDEVKGAVAEPQEGGGGGK